ncbi:ABC transporter ATP-binding protein [Sulfuritalea sp.]|uniref:ABC transporter ATP-binding protein n=1 Tax=Sulfuritalea sp. TaxID=2480090 RepID=UPI00286E1952|nr:ABC transporter ATP-binding protein [Sulfuritalea sp.]
MLNHIKDSLALANERERFLLLVLFVVNLAGAILEAGGVGLVYVFLKAVLEPETLGGLDLFQKLHGWLAIEERHVFFAVMTMFVMTVFLVRIAIQFVGTWMMLGMRKKLQTRVAGVLFSGYMRVPYVRHLSSKSSQLMNNVTANAGAAVAQCTMGLVEIASSVILAAVFVVTLLAVKPVETLVAVIVIAVLAIVYWRVMHERLVLWGRRMMRANEGVYAAVGETAAAIKTIKVNGVEKAFEERFGALVEEQMSLTVKNGLAQQTPRLVLESVIVVGVFGTMFSIFAVGKTVQSIIPTMALFGIAALRMAPAFVRIIAALQLYRNSTPCLEAILPDYREFESGHRENLDDGTPPSRPLVLDRSIELENVVFRYAGTDSRALNGVDIEIASGQLIGFAGSSGSGKSTTVDILLGLLEPTSGSVLIDGEPRLPVGKSGQKGLFAYVPQEPLILDDTIRNNVAFGVKPALIDDDRVYEALKGAALYDKVAGLPGRLNSALGERGNAFSGGERQRLGIARALYLDAPVIILDEPTASLDATTEHEVTEAIRKLRGSKTIVVIAHRLSSIFHCDTIYFFEDGKVAGQGSFNELTSDLPAFRKMVEHLRCGDAPAVQ